MEAMKEAQAKKLCFDRNDLHSKDVSISEFVANVRMKAPLSTLREDLRFHLDEISESLIEQIQTNFTSFISLGQSVADVDHLVDSIAAPVVNLQEEVDVILSSFDSDIEKLATTLEKRRKLASRRNLLELYLRISDLMHKCERLLKEVESCDPNSDEKYRILERTAGVHSQLQFCLTKVDRESKYIKALQEQVDKLAIEVKRRLEAWLREALDSNQGMIVRALASLAAAGMVADAEKLFRSEVVALFVSARLRMSSCTASAEKRKENSDESVTTADALESAEEFIQTFVKEKCDVLLTLCEEEERLRSFDFVNRAIWPEIELGIATNMNVFSPGIASVFHRSFTIATRIFGIMEKAARTPEKLETLHNHDCTKEFWRRWNLMVYFQLRFQEISLAFEDSFESKPAVPQAKKDEDVDSGVRVRLLSPVSYKLPATKALVISLKKCWDDDVFLQPLTHRFLRLSLQLLARYAHWARAGLDGEWGPDIGPKEIAQVYVDVETLGERLSAELASVVRMGVTGKLESGITSAIDNAFLEGVGGLTSLLPIMADHLATLISKSCNESLQALPGFLATYRMTNRPAPTKHTSFIPNVLKPLRQFLSDKAISISDRERKKIVRKVIELTVNRYYEITKEVLDNVRQTADTLRRLKIGQKDNQSKSAGPNAEMDKITMQLYLDVRKFGADIDALGVSTEDSPAYQKLWSCVNVSTPEKSDSTEA